MLRLLQSWDLAPLTIPSKQYTTELAEVFSLGKKNSTERNQTQTETAYFWWDNNSEYLATV